MAKTKSKGGNKSGYTAGVKLPDGRKLISTPSALREERTTTNEIVLENKETAQKIARAQAKKYKEIYGVEAQPYVGHPWQGEKDKPTATKKTEKANPVVQSKAAVQPKAAKTPAQKKTTYTVRGKTFATLAEAKAYKAAQKAKAGKPCEIKEGTRKPSHKIVSFTAKK